MAKVLHSHVTPAPTSGPERGRGWCPVEARGGLTARGLPAHGVEVAAAVVEHELVL